MTIEETAALRQQAQDWKAAASNAPANLLVLYENIVEAFLQAANQENDVLAAEAIAEAPGRVRLFGVAHW